MSHSTISTIALTCLLALPAMACKASDSPSSEEPTGEGAAGSDAGDVQTPVTARQAARGGSGGSGGSGGNVDETTPEGGANAVVAGGGSSGAPVGAQPGGAGGRPVGAQPGSAGGSSGGGNVGIAGGESNVSDGGVAGGDAAGKPAIGGDAAGELADSGDANAGDANAGSTNPNDTIGAAWANWPMPNGASSGLPNAASYSVETAGVVLDQVTGLMWQRTASSWQGDQASGATYCSELSLAGHNDWRLPSRIELVSLVDTTQSGPALASVFTQETQNETQSNAFWSSTLAPKEGVPWAWLVQFVGGATLQTSTDSGHSTRCVRSDSPTAGGPQYTFAGEGPTATVTDAATGLVWQRVLESRLRTFDEAQAYCRQLTLDGSPFRVPSLTELQTLVDQTAPAAPTLNSDAFPDTPSARHWTSALSVSIDGGAWFVSFSDGTSDDFANVLGDVKDAEFDVRCVR